MGESAFGCVKSTIRLRSGLYLDLADPKPEQFTLADIAGALAKVCRFGGQVPRFYSVAEHCVRCAEVAATDEYPEEIQIACLMHDASEAFLGDMVKPLKVMMGNYRVLECDLMGVIAAKFGIDFEECATAVEEIDRAMLIAERRALFSADAVTWTGENDVRRLAVQFDCWDWKCAEMKFMEHAEALRIGHQPGSQ